MNLVLIGPPGAGKGTQATVLREKYSIPHVSTGDILRERVSDGSEIGTKAKAYMDKGQLVPDEIVTQMVKERLSGEDCTRGFILDGFPRTLKQAESLELSLEELNKTLDSVLNFDASEEIIIERLTGRRICSRCGSIFHVKNIPPREIGKCDQCQGELIQRKDDEEATIRNRLRIYRESTEPLLEHYRAKDLLKTVPADLDYREIGKMLDDYFNMKMDK